MSRAGLTLAGAAILACSLSAGLTTVTHGRARVIDGDTLELTGPAWQLHRKLRVRLVGIDAPEKRQRCRFADGVSYPCGEVSADVLRGLVGDREVSCAPDPHRDRYRRLLAHCSVTGYYLTADLDLDTSDKAALDLGLFQVLRGRALAYRRYSLEYLAPEEYARAHHAGIWSGTFEAPWDWRKRGN